MIALILRIAGFVLFLIGTFPVSARFNLTNAGLACWIMAEILGRGILH
jgi:hypothetical protein